MKSIWRKLISRFRQARFDEDLAEEIRLHQELRTQRFREAGLAAKAAADAASRQFGNATRIREASRDAWSWRWLDEFAQDVRYACRLLAKNLAFTAVVSLTLALAIGANTAVFSILDGVLLRPLPYRNPQRLVVIWNRMTRGKNTAPFFASYQDFEQIKRYARSFSNVSAATWAWGPGRIWTDGKRARTILAEPASEQFFRTLGVSAARGRTFDPADNQLPCAIVLSHPFWQQKLAAKRDVVGSALTVDDRACTVLGVMPSSFSFYPRQTQLWILASPNLRPSREKLIVGIFARLKPGVTLKQAQTEITALHHAMRSADANERYMTPIAVNLQEQFTFLASRTLHKTIGLAAGAVLFILLIACLNVANLLLGRSLTRERELAVRAALGSGKARLMRQLLTESLALAVLGASAGLAIAFGIVAYFNHANPIELPVGSEVKIDFPVLVFSGALTLATVLIFGLLPAVKASQIDVGKTLKAAGRSAVGQFSRQHIARTIVAAEMALSVVLLVGAGLLAISLFQMRDASLGFDPHNLRFIGSHLPLDRYPDASSKARFYRDFMERLEGSLPAEKLALCSNNPLYWSGADVLEMDGRSGSSQTEAGDVSEVSSSPGFFSLLRTPFLRGRDFNARDRGGSQPVAIISKSLAQEYFPQGNALGKQVRLRDESHQNPWATIVGVVGDTKHSSLMHEMSWQASPTLYRPMLQSPSEQFLLFVRGGGNVGKKVAAVLAATDNRIPGGDELESIESDLSLLLSFARFRAVLVGAFALTAVLLTGVGLHGVLAQLVSQRTPEFGIRMAIGAKAHDIFLAVASEVALPVVGGLVSGLGAALVLGKWTASLLYGVRATAPQILFGVTILLLVVVALASMLPARRAVRVDPAVALRNE